MSNTISADVRIHSRYDDTITKYHSKSITVTDLENGRVDVICKFTGLFIVNPVYIVMLIPEHEAILINITEKISVYSNLNINFKMDMPKKLVLGDSFNDQFIEYMLRGLEDD